MLKNNEKEALIPYLSPDACCALSECVKNVLENPNIVSNKRKKLSALLKIHKKDLRAIANNKTNDSLRHKKIKKVGGAIISTILGVAIPLLLSYLMKK